MSTGGTICWRIDIKVFDSSKKVLIPFLKLSVIFESKVKIKNPDVSLLNVGSTDRRPTCVSHGMSLTLLLLLKLRVMNSSCQMP